MVHWMPVAPLPPPHTHTLDFSPTKHALILVTDVEQIHQYFLNIIITQTLSVLPSNYIDRSGINSTASLKLGREICLIWSENGQGFNEACPLPNQIQLGVILPPPPRIRGFLYFTTPTFEREWVNLLVQFFPLTCRDAVGILFPCIQEHLQIET